MVDTGFALNDFDTFIFAEFSNDGADFFFQMAVYDFSSSLGYPDYVVFAFPYAVR